MNKPSSPDPSPEEHPELITAQSRVALVLFAVYLTAYGGFMGLTALAPSLMARPVLQGVNLAIVYGLGLIFGAVLLALLYMALCRRLAKRLEEDRT